MRGLLGKKLSHSFSKEIHEKLDGKKYDLIEIEDLGPFFHSGAFECLNVTIPYKNEVIKYVNHLSVEAKTIQAVNTIIKREDGIYGYITDVDGLEFLLDYNRIFIQGKTIGILGNGSTAQVIKYVVNKLGAKSIYTFARNPKENESHFDNKVLLNEVNILFNATPNGMYPHNEAELLIDVDQLKVCSHVVDLIYNPLRTTLMIAAEKRNIKAVNGLMMLIHQAVVANQLFNDITYPKETTVRIYKEILLETLNVVLIGMPMSGKSYYSRVVSEHYGKNIIDIDKKIEEENNLTIPEIFESKGESEFRNLEQQVIRNISKRHNLAVSTGGGIVLNEQNVDYLKQNGIILFLDMSLKDLMKCNPKDRPLLQDPENLIKLYDERYCLYNEYCDKRVVKRGFKRKETLSKIEVKINEYINS